MARKRGKEDDEMSKSVYSSVVLNPVTPEQKEKFKIHKANLKKFVAGVKSANKIPEVTIHVGTTLSRAYFNSGKVSPSQKQIKSLYKMSNLGIKNGRGSPGVVSEVVSAFMRVSNDENVQESYQKLVDELAKSTPDTIPLIRSTMSKKVKNMVYNEYIKMNPKPNGVEGVFMCTKCGNDVFEIRFVKARANDEGMITECQCLKCPNFFTVS